MCKAMSKIFKKTKELVTMCDLFSTTELLRYRQNPQYKSANGGLCSIAVIIAFAIIFTQTIFNTFSKTTIASQTSFLEETDPSYYTTGDAPYIFALGVSGYNLNHPSDKYFNIEISQKSVVNGKKKTVIHSLVPCNRSVWTSFDNNLGESYDTIGLDSWLCLPQNISLEFGGKFTSKIFNYIKISVKSCSIVVGDTRTCVSESMIDANMSLGSLSFNYYFVNTIINADSQNYLGSYLEDRNFFQFTKQLGTSANIYISSYTINTDESLWPWTAPQQDTGGIVHEQTQRYVYVPIPIQNTTEYVSLFLRKSSLSLYINRAFKKYDDTLSYIGGLFSTFMVALFIMMKYNQYSYEIDIASKIYKQKKKHQIASSKFNIITFFGYGFYCLLDLLNIAPNWTIMKHFDDVREEIGKQLDLKLLLRKISFLQDCIGYIFEEYQLQCLHLKEKMSLSEAEIIRKRFSSRRKILKFNKKINKQFKYEKQPEQIQQQHNMKTSNSKVFDSSQLTNQPQHRNKRIQNEFISANYNVEQLRQQEADQVFEQQQYSNQEKLVFIKCIESINNVKSEASKGNSRCQKIYKNLDRVIKNLPNTLKILEKNEQSNAINDTQQKIDVGVKSSKKHLDQTFNIEPLQLQ